MSNKHASEASNGVGEVKCAGCQGCPLGKLLREGRLSTKIDPVRFQSALVRKGCPNGLSVPSNPAYWSS